MPVHRSPRTRDSHERRRRFLSCTTSGFRVDPKLMYMSGGGASGDAPVRPLRRVVLDVRNGYEWDVGRFESAERPDVANFYDTDPVETFGLPSSAEERAETEVMMYCTGGIRCEYFSARLKAQGFEKVYKLQGGVQHYGNRMANRGVADTTATSETTSGSKGEAARVTAR